MSKSESYKAVWHPNNWGSQQDFDWYFLASAPHQQFISLIDGITVISKAAAYFSQQRKPCRNPSQQREWWGEIEELPKNFKKPRTYWVVSFNLWVVSPSPPNSWLSGPKYSWLKISWRSPERVLQIMREVLSFLVLLLFQGSRRFRALMNPLLNLQ